MDYKVPMHEQSVEVGVAGDPAARYVIYLAPSPDREGGTESIEEYLNRGRTFFPMVSEGLGTIVNRDQIEWIKVASEPEHEDEGRPGVQRKSAIFMLVTGLEIEGELLIDRPQEQSRISDVLNDASILFLRVEADDAVWYLSKRHLRMVLPR